MSNYPLVPQIQLLNSIYGYPQLWVCPSYHGNGYQQTFSGMTNYIYWQRENRKLRIKLLRVEEELRLEKKTLKIEEAPPDPVPAKILPVNEEQITTLREELSKMTLRYEELTEKYSELEAENSKCVHENQEKIVHLKQKLSKIRVKFEKRLKTDCELDAINAKCKQEHEEEIAYLKQQLMMAKQENELDMENPKCILEKEKEIDHLKQQLSKLAAYVQDLKGQIHDRNAKINALNVINDMLAASNESRDETIIQYKKKLQKYTKERSSSDSDSVSKNLSPLKNTVVESNISKSLNAVHNMKISDCNPLPKDLLSIKVSNIPTIPNTSLSSNEGQDYKDKTDPLPDNVFPLKDMIEESTLPTPSPNAVHNWRSGRETMQGLAENKMRPWLCQQCGVNGWPLKIATYPEFRQHLIEVHNEVVDSALCVKCGWRSRDGLDLDFHMFKQHQVPSLFYSFSKSEFSTSFASH